MKSLAVISLLASLVLAQDTTNPLIPSGISTSCQNFYVQLDANTTLSQCLKPIISATAQLITGANSTNISTSVVTSALSTICSPSNTCDGTLIGAQLGLFYQACQDELTVSKTQGVILTYDVLYLLGPLQKALCQKDGSGSYCVANASSPTTKRASLLRRADSQEAFIPNITAFNEKDIAFLGLQPSLSAAQLCIPCTRDIMTVYTTQLNNVPYGPGIPNSLLLADEPALYSAINTKCGASFLGGEVQAAGGLATGTAPRSADSTFALVGSAIVAAAAGAVALL